MGNRQKIVGTAHLNSEREVVMTERLPDPEWHPAAMLCEESTQRWRQRQWMRVLNAGSSSAMTADARTRAMRICDATGYVYFIREEGGDAVKIGWSDDVDRRVAELQTGNPRRLVLVAKVRCARRSEREMHRRFAHHRVKGEWFTCHEEILAYAIQQDAASRELEAMSGTCEPDIICAFCAASRINVRRMIAGPLVHICDVCVMAAARLIQDEEARILDEEPKAASDADQRSAG